MQKLTPEVEKLIKHYQLEVHPEGGFFRQTYQASESCKNAEGQTRSCSTSIYFLLPEGHKSHFHRLKSDEVWHFHQGSSLTVVEITKQGQLIQTTLGQDYSKGEKLQHVVPAGRWFGSYSNGKYSLVGCTVSPGFDYADFELTKRTDLVHQFPNLTSEIHRLTPDLK
jgi:predicted cupin superfamily sugar epimerase